MVKKTETEVRTTISVCIPNYNRASNLKQVLRDCAQQTVPPFEIIIQDDSTDDREIRKIDALMHRYPQVRFYRNRKNLGLAANVNAVLKRARGQYIVIVNNDDRLSRTYIEQLQQAVKRYPGYNIYATNACAIDDKLSVIGEYRIATTDLRLKKRTGIRRLWKRFMINLISISGATMYRRSFLVAHPFRSELGNETDLDRALDLLASQDIMYIDTPIYFVRMNAQNTSVHIRSEEERRDLFIARCLSIYRAYARSFRHVQDYIETPKSIYVLQLLGKYRYSIKKVWKLLSISGMSEFIQIIVLAVRYPIVHGVDMLRFQLHKREIEQFAPTA